jgi:hypothetical protein
MRISGDKNKKHKRKRESSDERHKERSEPKVKSPEMGDLTEMPNSTSQMLPDVDDLFGDPPPKKAKPADEKIGGVLKISSSKRPKFFVSSKIDENPIVKEVKEEQPSKVNIFINFHSLAIYNRI